MTTPVHPRLLASSDAEIVSADAQAILDCHRSTYRWARRVLMSSGPLDLGAATTTIGVWVGAVVAPYVRHLRVIGIGSGGELRVTVTVGGDDCVVDVDLPGTTGAFDESAPLPDGWGGGVGVMVVEVPSGMADLERIVILEDVASIPPPIPDPEELVMGGLGENATEPAGPPVPMTRRVRGGLGMSESVTGGGVGTFVDIGGYEN
jgi:hypothetical protein